MKISHHLRHHYPMVTQVKRTPLYVLLTSVDKTTELMHQSFIPPPPELLWDICIPCQCVKSDTAVLFFLFPFSHPLFFCFSCTEYLVSLTLVGNISGHVFWILGLDERNGTWVVEQDFLGSTLHSFFPFSTASLTESCSLWYMYVLKPLITLLKLADKVVPDH